MKDKKIIEEEIKKEKEEKVEKEIKKEEPSYYVLSSVDNINIVAKKFNTTVEKLKELNKDIDLNKAIRFRVK